MKNSYKIINVPFIEKMPQSEPGTEIFTFLQQRLRSIDIFGFRGKMDRYYQDLLRQKSLIRRKGMEMLRES